MLLFIEVTVQQKQEIEFGFLIPVAFEPHNDCKYTFKCILGLLEPKSLIDQMFNAFREFICNKVVTYVIDIKQQKCKQIIHLWVHELDIGENICNYHSFIQYVSE